MNKRPLPDIVADLRWEQAARIRHEAADLLERLDVLRPPCPTCDGKNYKPMFVSIDPLDYKCPDCVDGRMSWEWVAAIATAVFDLSGPTTPTILYLRSGLYGSAIRGLRKITARTVDDEPKWRVKGKELVTGYKGQWR